jgi:hypothetical protein
MNRRKLLQFFSIGATITPMLNGSPVVEAAAKLLAVPEVRPLVLAEKFPAGHSPEHYLERVRWNPYEAIWLKFWQIENSPPSYLNSGIGTLEHCLQREPTPEEKTAVAAIIQWFGSNCGHAFIEETLKACGYRVTFDKSLPNADEIQKLQHRNIWAEPEWPQRVSFSRRGRTVTLKPNEHPEVSA